MESFFSELKRVREASGISLAEISDATLINMKMLEALERGDTGSLPEAYVRAFIRGYAGAIGLDKDATMAQYDAARKPPDRVERKPALTAATITDTPAPAPLDPPAPKVQQFFSERLKPALGKIVMAIVALVLINFLLWNLLNREPSHTVQETPFRDVVKEQEKKAGRIDTNRIKTSLQSTASTKTPTRSDSAQHGAAQIPAAIVFDKDSITLVATTSDSVWMQIVVDDDRLSEHYLMPHSTTVWRAKSEFWISAIGNPAAIKLALNNKPIPVPVRPGFVTRDLRISRESLQTP